MPTRYERNERRIRQIERITNRIKDPADRLFGGDTAKGFLYWAVDLHLDQTENSPTVDDLQANITDGRDDLELDAYYIDDDARTVFLFQSKYRSTPGNLQMRDLASFLDVPNKLTTPAILDQLSNRKILEFLPAFRRRIRDRYELQLVYLTTLRATDRLHTRAREWSEGPLSLSSYGEYIDVAHSAIIVDIDYIVSVIDSLNRIREVELTLEIDRSGYHESKAGDFPCLIATLQLKELAKAFDTHKFAILQYNPRGPLGAVGPNKDIRETLKDSSKRGLFQLMNNGLSAVCTGFTLLESGGVTKVNVRDFQIVNGCQTTYEVYGHWLRGGDLNEATVTLKLVETPTSALRYMISAASNKQSQMKDWDFLFDDPVQIRLQGDFRSLTPPIFYELRRGEFKYISSYTSSEKITVKNIAQTMWAFIGFPGEAKDRIREVPRSRDALNGVYRDVFHPEIEAERLLLPWIVYKKVYEEWRRYNNTSGEQGDEREHGRLHILWLIGRSVVRMQNVSHYREISMPKIRQLTATIDDWFPLHHRLAVETITWGVTVEKGIADASGRPLSLRQLFRSNSKYGRFIEQHDRIVEENRAILSEGLAAA